MLALDVYVWFIPRKKRMISYTKNKDGRRDVSIEREGIVVENDAK
jgi:hypothetical protein